MIAAPTAEDLPRGHRMLVVSRERCFESVTAEIGSMLTSNDLVVVNDSATLPASFFATRSGVPLEVRLLRPARREGEMDLGQEWTAVLFGAGDFRTRTEDRPSPPRLTVGDALIVARDLTLEVSRVHDGWKHRLVDVRFPARGEALFRLLYRHGRPIQYAHTRVPLAIWDVQTGFADRPWSIEPPSAGFFLRGSERADLAARGVTVAPLTHAAGISTLGDEELDRRLPLPERSSIPRRTAALVGAAKERGGRIIAVGTTVMRALEGNAARHGSATASDEIVDLVITDAHRRRIVDGLLTGMHELGTSHHRILESFASKRTLTQAFAFAERAGFRSHEFGDAMLVLPSLNGER